MSGHGSDGDTSSDSDNNGDLSPAVSLPPPPLALLEALVPTVRVRNFPHIDGKYALHVYIPVSIPPLPKKEIASFLKNVSSVVHNVHLVGSESDVPLNIENALGREFHISLGRCVPLRVHQINSLVSMLRQKLLQFHKTRYLIDFNQWQVFVNDDSTRSFLSLEITNTGLSEISKQIDAVNEVYKLHNLPQFYKDPRPHISLVWALGDIRTSLMGAVDGELRKLRAGGSLQNRIFTSKFSGIDCKVGNKIYKICKQPNE